jgi:outer membrane protein
MEKQPLTRWSAKLLIGMTGFIVCSFLSPGGAHAADTLTLDDYFAAALKRSEVVATQQELIRQAEERYQQAGGALLPTVSGIGSYTWRDRAGIDTPTTPASEPQARITATQPLFRGMREFAGLRQTRALRDAQSDDYQSARVQLYKDVAQNFFDVLTLEKDLSNLDEQISQNVQREKELQDRVRIGRSRTGEVLTVQSTISTLRAQEQQLRAQLSTAREAFAFLSGAPAATPLRDTETLPTDVATLESYLARIGERPDVRAARQRLSAANEGVDVARGAHLPSLDLNANRYLERRGTLSEVDWDAQLVLTIPIYAGGGTQSRVRETLSQRDQSELAASQITRQSEQEIRSVYRSVTLDRAQLDALETATTAAKKNYEVQLRDYRLGLVTNLDVLQSLTTYQENQRALDRARYAAKLNFVKLEAAAVRRPPLPAATAEGNAR